MISVSGNTFQFRAKEKRKVPQEHNFCARLLDWLRNLRKAVQEMTFVPAPMCPCQDRLSYLRSDHMLVRFLIARQLGTWSFAGPATDDNRCRSGSTPHNPHEKWSFMFVQVTHQVGCGESGCDAGRPLQVLHRFQMSQLMAISWCLQPPNCRQIMLQVEVAAGFCWLDLKHP